MTKKREDGSEYVYVKTTFVKKRRLENDEDIKLLIFDECSMISEKLWDDLMTFGKR